MGQIKLLRISNIFALSNKDDTKISRRNLLALGAAFGGVVSIAGHDAIAQFADGGSNQIERQKLAIGSKENITQALIRAGANSTDVTIAVRALARVIDVSDIKKDDQLTIFLRQDGNIKRLLGFNLASSAQKSITVSRTVDGNYKARELSTSFKRRTLRIAGTIGADGLMASVTAQGAPERTAETLADAFAYDVDFEREIGPGCSFELMFDRIFDQRGAVVREGEPTFVTITLLSGRSISLYRYLAPGASSEEWFDTSGRSARKFLMKTPINGAHLTSGFGMRFHPVLGYTKMHTGVDFGAKVGTPVLAAGDGVVTRASIMGGYGNVVDIDHGNGWSTRYAHLSRFGSGLRVGDRVRQNSQIAFSGNTGRSTGPHLHFEVRKNGEAIDPLSARVPSSRVLDGDALSKFKAQISKIEQDRRQAVTGANIYGQSSMFG